MGSEDPLTVPRPGQKTRQVSGGSRHLLVACQHLHPVTFLKHSQEDPEGEQAFV